MEQTQVIRSHVRLLAAVLGKDPDKVGLKFGLCPPQPKGRRCRGCGKRIRGSGRRYCYECGNIPIACDWCGKVVMRRRVEVMRSRAKVQFCDGHCRGSWWAAHHGFKVHPENTLYVHKRKWDYELVWREHLATGWGRDRLARLLAMPLGTVGYILGQIKGKKQRGKEA